MTIINRNNYEEIFLLYVDDELDAASKLAVENFVQQNPDLAVELDMLLQTKCVVDETVFFDKESLLRTEGNGIKEDNYQEYFLLYIDNELSATKREEVEMYVLQHPKLQDEFTTLKQAVLAPEFISYGDKKDLYRTEKRRTIYLKSWRLAAAAIFIGVCAVGFWLMEKPATTVTVAVNPVQDQPKQNMAVTKPVDSSQEITKQPEQVLAHEQSSSPVKKEKKNVVAVAKNEKETTTDNNKSVAENTSSEEPQIVIQQAPVKHNDIANNQKEPLVETNIAVAPKQIDQKQNVVTGLQAQQVQQTDNNHNVYPVAYKEINTSDDNNSLHVGMLDLNKTKVKTFLKKAGRIFGNKSNDLANEDGKLQVANFEIDTKKL